MQLDRECSVQLESSSRSDRERRMLELTGTSEVIEGRLPSDCSVTSAERKLMQLIEDTAEKPENRKVCASHDQIGHHSVK
jgi:hypothetical protein